jgi:threonine/homoserine/homoserine lactone efflux protein
MIPTNVLVVYLATSLVLTLTPGPDMMYVFARTVAQGRKAGFASLFGIGAGFLVHILAASLGLSTLLRTSAVAFSVIKYAGAAYLVYLGIQAWRATGALPAEKALRGQRSLSAFRQGFVTNVLNPKIALFFLAFVPQFVDPARGSTTVQFVLFGLLLNLLGMAVHALVVMAAATLGPWLEKSPASNRIRQRVTGGAFLALGARLALVDRD